MEKIGKKEIELFFGRFQPIYKEHLEAIKKIDNGVVVIVRGKDADKDKVKNPIPLEMQKEIISKAAPNASIKVFATGYLPEIIDLLRKEDLEVVVVHSSPGRVDEFTKWIDEENEKRDDDTKFSVKIKEIAKNKTAYDMKKSVIDNNKTKFIEMMPDELEAQWEPMRDSLTIKEGAIVSFEQYLVENAITTAAVEFRNPVMTAPTPLKRQSLETKDREEQEEDAEEIKKKAVEELREQKDIPNADDGLNKMRHGMPQIKDWDAFVQDVKNNKKEIIDEEVEPDTLKPSQKNFNDEKIQRIIDEEAFDNPIVTSNDGFVIDGHHRWMAAHKMGRKIACRKIDMTADEIFEMCKDAPYVEKKKINESVE